jgi:hypothetical protein
MGFSEPYRYPRNLVIGLFLLENRGVLTAVNIITTFPTPYGSMLESQN